MGIWLVRAGRSGEREEFALEKGVAVVGWAQMGSMEGVATREELLGRLQERYPESKVNALKNWLSQLWPFLKEIEPGDIVAMPLKGRPMVAFGRVKGAYRHDPQAPEESRNQIPVEWFKELPRQGIPQDILYSLGAFMTVCRIYRNDAEKRLTSLLEKGIDPAVTATGVGDAADASEVVDLEAFSREQIRAAMYAKFKGHGLSQVVAAVLEAQGYRTHVSPAGPDGGVDVVAGSGPLGFDAPRLAVQVKSEHGPVDVRVVRELHGVMRDFGADHGLVVAWGGFKSSVVRESARKYFEIRLWSSDDLVAAVLAHYDQLPADLRAELPLKRIWTLVQEGE